MTWPNYVYVASSWRNGMQPAVIKILEAADILCYDFKNPAPGDNGFHWSDVSPDWKKCRCNHMTGRHGFCSTHAEPRRSLSSAPAGTRVPEDQTWYCECPTGDGTMSPESYLEAIAHPIAEAGFLKDYAAMQKADAFVLVLPCGRSAHLELGWALGSGIPSAILLDDPVTPELMYKIVEQRTHAGVGKICTNVMELLAWLGVED